MTFAELWLTYQLASRAHLKNSATTQLIDLEFQNHKLIDLEDVLEHGNVVTVFRQGFVEPKFRPSTWWEKGDGLKLKASHLVEELLNQGVGRTPETSLKLVIQDMPTTLWFTYVYRHNSSAPHVAQRVKLAEAAHQQGRMDLVAHLTNYVFSEGYLPNKLRSVVHWEDGCGKKIQEHFRVEEVLSWDLGCSEEKPLRLVIDDHHHQPVCHKPSSPCTPIHHSPIHHGHEHDHCPRSPIHNHGPTHGRIHWRESW